MIIFKRVVIGNSLTIHFTIKFKGDSALFLHKFQNIKWDLLQNSAILQYGGQL